MIDFPSYYKETDICFRATLFFFFFSASQAAVLAAASALSVMLSPGLWSPAIAANVQDDRKLRDEKVWMPLLF